MAVAAFCTPYPIWVTWCGGGEGWVIDLVTGCRGPGCVRGACTVHGAGTKWIPERCNDKG